VSHSYITKETETEIFYDSAFIALRRFIPPNIIIKEGEKWIKHVRCSGTGFHILSHTMNGIFCSEPDCILNKHEEGS
jgi:hypothetical protein